MNLPNNLPHDFSPTEYKRYNPDLAKASDDWVCWHYVNFGVAENRIYKIETLPAPFNVEHYKFYNPDLRAMTDMQAIAHASRYAVQEKRRCFDEYYDKDFFERTYTIENSSYSDYIRDIAKLKSRKAADIIDNTPKITADILLVDHFSEINGASHHLFLLYGFLKEKLGISSAIATPQKNKTILDKYNIPEASVVEFFDDPTILYHICKKAESRKIYFNSMSQTLSQVMEKLDRSRLIFHAMEVKEHYHSFDYKPIPDFSIMPGDIKNYGADNNVKYQPCLMSEEFYSKMDQQSKEAVEIKNTHGNIDSSRITLGMSGILSSRKNYKLFVELASRLPQFNFLWIGGVGNLTENPTDNLYHVPQVTNPFKYYSQIDYFVLFSAIEPMGYVLLENMYLGNSVIAFDDSLITKFSTKNVEHFFHVLPGAITLNSLLTHIPSICAKKPKKYKKDGGMYVRDFFRIADSFVQAF